ncbi:MAG: hypothetical protein Q9218_005315 [Villophora microphyllina]
MTLKTQKNDRRSCLSPANKISDADYQKATASKANTKTPREVRLPPRLPRLLVSDTEPVEPAAAAVLELVPVRLVPEVVIGALDVAEGEQ